MVSSVSAHGERARLAKKQHRVNDLAVAGRKPDRNPIRDVVYWALDHVELDINFEGVSPIVVGDPVVFAGVTLNSDLEISSPWQWLEGAGGTALAIRGPTEDSDGPWVWVLGSDDGPLSSVEISARLETSTNPAPSQFIGNLAMPSGRLVVGSPSAVLAAGRDIDVTSKDRPAQFRNMDNAGELIRDGYIVILKAPYGNSGAVFISPSPHPDRVLGLSVKLPTPGWLPPLSPITQPD